MDVILHLGAHRTGTTTFQDYLRRHSAMLSDRQIAYWGPRRTRKGGLNAVLSGERIPAATLRGGMSVPAQLSACSARGMDTLLISDENMIGSVRGNMKSQVLYPSVGPRMKRFAAALDHPIKRVLISPRSLDYFWASSIAFGVSRGHPVPDPFACRRIAQSRRSWSDVITELAQALPDTEIRVLPFEAMIGRPEALLELGMDIHAPLDTDRKWLNRAPSLPELRRTLHARRSDAQILPFGMERWNPFTPDDTAALRELYADDMMWLTAGAGGLAKLTEERTSERAGTTLSRRAATQGQDDERQKGSMA